MGKQSRDRKKISIHVYPSCQSNIPTPWEKHFYTKMAVCLVKVPPDQDIISVRVRLGQLPTSSFYNYVVVVELIP